MHGVQQASVKVVPRPSIDLGLVKTSGDCTAEPFRTSHGVREQRIPHHGSRSTSLPAKAHDSDDRPVQVLAVDSGPSCLWANGAAWELLASQGWMKHVLGARWLFL